MWLTRRFPGTFGIGLSGDGDGFPNGRPVHTAGRRRCGTIGALLRPRHVQRQSGCDDQHRYPYDSYLIHVHMDLLFVL